MSSSQIVKFHSRLKSVCISFCFLHAPYSLCVCVCLFLICHIITFQLFGWLWFGSTFLNIVSLVRQVSAKKWRFLLFDFSCEMLGAFCLRVKEPHDVTDSIKCCCYFWLMLAWYKIVHVANKLFSIWISIETSKNSLFALSVLHWANGEITVWFNWICTKRALKSVRMRKQC